MKSLFLISVLFYTATLSSEKISTAIAPASGDMIIEIENIQPLQGWIEIKLYDKKEKFLDRNGFAYRQRIPVGQASSVVFNLKNIKYGVYAVTSYHDINSNDKFDTNLVGLPKEPYALYRTFRNKWRAPKFEDVQFEFKESQSRIKMKLEKF